MVLILFDCNQIHNPKHQKCNCYFVIQFILSNKSLKKLINMQFDIYYTLRYN